MGKPETYNFNKTSSNDRIDENQISYAQTVKKGNIRFYLILMMSHSY